MQDRISRTPIRFTESARSAGRGSIRAALLNRRPMPIWGTGQADPRFSGFRV